MSIDGYNVIELAFNNSYNILFYNNVDVDHLIMNGDGYFVFHPSELPTKQEINNMIKYFSEQEEYEKCIKLTNYIKCNLENIRKT